ncbi:MAG: AraC family transcriptional regulator [Vicinamibacterales bacterium]
MPHDPSSALDVRTSGFDVVSDVLRSIRLTGSMLFLVDATSPWNSWAPDTEAFRRLVLPDSPHLVSYHLVIDGACWAGLRDAPPVRLEAGDVMVVPRGDAYRLCDPPEAPPSYGHRDALAFFELMASGRLPPLVAQGGAGPRAARFLCGFLGSDRPAESPVLAALPRMVTVRTGAGPDRAFRHLVDFALAELAAARPGGRSVALRLAELMFVEIVRAHFAAAGPVGPGWLAGLRDPVAARVLGCFHEAPAARWTLAALARRCGVSRTVLSERFTAHVGVPPMEYLTRWRMQLASRHLARPGATVAGAARAAGYDSEAAFSRQFKRRVGVPPSARTGVRRRRSRA